MALCAQCLIFVGMDAVEAQQPQQRSAHKLVRPKIKVVGGNDLAITIKPKLSKQKYRFVLARQAGKKWKKLGTYKTTSQTVLDVRSGKYRIDVKHTKTTKAASKTFNYSEALQPQPEPATAAGHYAVDYDWVYYFPAGYTPAGHKYPVIITYSPGQVDSPPGPYDAYLKNIADRYGFIVLSSRLYRNPPSGAEPHVDERYQDQFSFAFNWRVQANQYCSRDTIPSWAISGIYDLARFQIQNVFDALPIDQSRVVLMGISGGASFAHAMNIWYPGLASAVVINTGMIWGTALPANESANGPAWNAFVDTCRHPSDYAGATREAWFLESSDGPVGPDFRYDEMKADEVRYRDIMGWDLHVIDFYGGHAMAPVSVYGTVFDQLTHSMGW